MTGHGRFLRPLLAMLALLPTLSVPALARSETGPAADGPLPVAVLTAEDIRRSGATSIPEALRRLTGVTVWEWGLGQSDVSLRGSNRPRNDQLLVLINGRRVNIDTWNAVSWRALPVQLIEIKRIEIFKGPASAFFGANAGGGVIRITTVAPGEEDGGGVMGRYGTQFFRQSGAVLTMKLGKRGRARLSAGTVDFNEFDTPSTSDVEPTLRDDGRSRTTSLDTEFDIAPDRVVGVELTYSTSKLADRFVTWTPNTSDTTQWSVRSHYEARNRLGQLRLTVNRQAADTLFTQTGTAAESRRWEVEVDQTLPTGPKHDLKLSGLYRNTLMDGHPDPSGKIRQRTFAVGGAWTWRPTQRLSLVNAVRADMIGLRRRGTEAPETPFSNEEHDQNLTVLSFNSALAYRRRDTETIRLSASRGFSAPSLSQLGFSETNAILPPIINVITSGSPDLQATTTLQGELSYERVFPQAGVTARLSAFHQRASNVIGLESRFTQIPGTFNFTNLWANIGDSNTTGAELFVEKSWGDRWRASTGYTLLKVQDDLNNRDPLGLTRFLEFEEGTPAHQDNFHLAYTGERWEGDLYGLYRSGHRMINSQTLGGFEFPTLDPVEGQFTVDARLGYRLAEAVTAALEGQSLLQADYAPTSGPRVERRLLVSLTGPF